MELPEKCDRVIERILVEPKNVGTALSIVFEEAKSAKLFEIKSSTSGSEFSKDRFAIFGPKS